MRTLVPVAMTLMLAVLVAPPARACGDKFLVSGRNHRYNQSKPPVRMASVLMFLNAGAGDRALADSDLRSTLRDIGYKVRVAADEAALAKQLRNNKFDIVVSDLADADTVQGALALAASKAVLLPVVGGPAKDKPAAGGFEHVLSLPSAPDDIQSVIQDTLSLQK